MSTLATPAEKRTATRPTWADISLAKLRQNFRAVQRHVGNEVMVCAVVKADAYGHGSVECSRALEQEGARWLGVTSLDEAIPLREAGIQTRILLMTGFWRGEEAEIVRLGLTPTVWEAEQIESLNFVARGVSDFPVHLKVDTGMGRLGAAMEDLPEICRVLKASSRLALEGISTHLASSEVLDAASVEQQLRRFAQARAMVSRAGFDPPLVHAANTGAVIARTEALYSMVRPGIALYGYHLPFERDGKEVADKTAELPVAAVLNWKTRILSLRKMPANQALGYGGTYVTKSEATIAVLPVGYADGLNRQLSSRGRVIVRDQYAPIVGRVSMDLTLADVTNIPEVAVGDEVVLLGSCGKLSVDAMEHARLANTTPYEILCSISKRVPRKYI
ncbi:MAG: alanine racemase [Terriglobales bacterium]|nr:alanine racemase [Terriglobales bacterium]